MNGYTTEDDIQRKFRWPSLLLGILFVLVGILSFLKPGKAIIGITWILALSMLLSGIFAIWIYFTLRGSFGSASGFTLVTGILDIILAILVFFNLDTGFFMLGYFLAFWFLFDSINMLLLSSYSFHPGLNTLFSILGIIAGVLMLFNPLIGSLVVVYILAVYLLIFGIILIARAF